MTDEQVTPEWLHSVSDDLGFNESYVRWALDQAADALEAQRETINRLEAERDAERKRADYWDMQQAVLAGDVSRLEAALAAERSARERLEEVLEGLFDAAHREVSPRYSEHLDLWFTRAEIVLGVFNGFGQAPQNSEGESRHRPMANPRCTARYGEPDDPPPGPKSPPVFCVLTAGHEGPHRSQMGRQMGRTELITHIELPDVCASCGAKWPCPEAVDRNPNDAED